MYCRELHARCSFCLHHGAVSGVGSLVGYVGRCLGFVVIAPPAPLIIMFIYQESEAHVPFLKSCIFFLLWFPPLTNYGVTVIHYSCCCCSWNICISFLLISLFRCQIKLISNDFSSSHTYVAMIIFHFEKFMYSSFFLSLWLQLIVFR